MARADLDAAAEALSSTVRDGNVPGGVLLVGQADEVLLATAVGQRRIVPSAQPMELDTLFDVASLTKPLVTAMLAVVAIEDGALDLDAPVAEYVPAFSGEGREAATIRDLLTHSTGLPPWKDFPDNPPTAAEDRASRLEAAVADICRLPLDNPPGEVFAYSDLGFILLGSILEGLAGRTMDQAARDLLFAPAGMTSACFNPPADLADLCAATEVKQNGVPLQGVVHDENARYLGGIAGHAGLFATAADIGALCRALLRLGEGDAGRLLSAASVRLMTTRQSRHKGHSRGLGWDLDSDYVPAVRGRLFPRRGFGHSGFTGTSLWVDPPSGVWQVLLTNRVHPSRGGADAVQALRRAVADAVAEALLTPDVRLRSASRREPVRTGFEVQQATGWPLLKGARVGLIVNHSAVDSRRQHLIDELAATPDVEVARLFAPEHGLRGELDEQFADGRDERTGLPVVSLYGEQKAPLPEQIVDLDALVFDIQDAGVRFYTYPTTLVLAMRAAAEARVDFVVLDRPDLLPPDLVAGPILDQPFAGFAEYHPLPLIHGLTVAELARWSAGEYGIGLPLAIAPCANYARDLWFDETGLPWVNPSPNLRSLTAAALYPAIGMLERCRVSVGRGTTRPFEVLGAPWMEAAPLVERLEGLALPGLAFAPVEFAPSSREFAGETCRGCAIRLLDREAYRPVEAGMAIARAIEDLWPGKLKLEAMGGLLGDRQAVEMLAGGAEAEDISFRWIGHLAAYLDRRSRYLIY